MYKYEKLHTHCVFTILPEEHVILYIAGLCARHCNKDVTICHIADRLDLLVCKQTGSDPKKRDQITDSNSMYV